VELLCEHGANPNSKTKMGDSCLHLAVTRCDIQMISKLLAQGVDARAKNQLGDSVLHTACSIGDLATVQVCETPHLESCAPDALHLRIGDFVTVA